MQMETEMLTRQQEQLFGIQKLIKSCQLNLDDITTFIPGVVHLNKIQTLDLTYLDKQSREFIEVSRETLAKEGTQVLTDIVQPESFRQSKKLLGTMRFEDPSQVVSHFQSLRHVRGTSSYEWFYSVKKKFDDHLMITISNPISSLGEMQKQVEKILEENIFIKKNLPKVNSLTSREKEIIKLIFRGCSHKEIAEQLFISPHTVLTHQKNIRRKLEIKKYTELLKFAQEFDLV